MTENEEDERASSRRRSRLILSNGTWSAAQQGITTIANSAIAFLLVMVLPVHEYGVYSYATSLVTIAMTIMNAGLQGLAVKTLVNSPESNSAIMTALLLIREGLATVAYLLIVGVSLTSGTFETVAATLVAGASIFARAFDAPELWYRARMRNRVPAVIRIGVTLTLFAIRIAALWMWPSIWLFLALFVLDGILSGAWLMVRYARDREAPGFGRPDFANALSLLRQSIPLALSGAANQINLRGDVIVIQALLGSSAVGIYSVAARFSEIAYFLPVVFMNASLPILLQIRKEDGPGDKYRKFLQRSYDQAFWFGALTALGLGAVGSGAILLFLGPEYALSARILCISLLACPFIFMAAVFSKWIIAEGTLWVSLMRHSIGAGVNLGLNFILIPHLGLYGSAISTLTSYIAASYLACFIGKTTRLPAIQMTLAIVAPIRLVIGWFRRRRHAKEL